MSFKEKYNRGVNLDLSNRSQVATEMILDKPLTIIDFSMARTKNGECAIVIFEEMPDNFYFAGTVLTNILRDIAKDDFDLRELRKNGMKIKLFESENKDHTRKYVNVDILN